MTTEQLHMLALWTMSEIFGGPKPIALALHAGFEIHTDDKGQKYLVRPNEVLNDK